MDRGDGERRREGPATALGVLFDETLESSGKNGAKYVNPRGLSFATVDVKLTFSRLGPLACWLGSCFTLLALATLSGKERRVVRNKIFIGRRGWFWRAQLFFQLEGFVINHLALRPRTGEERLSEAFWVGRCQTARVVEVSARERVEVVCKLLGFDLRVDDIDGQPSQHCLLNLPQNSSSLGIA